MKSLKLKAFLIMVIIGIFMVCTPKLCYAANEEAVLVKQSENEYIIYMKQYLKQEFEFAFSNDNVAIAFLSSTDIFSLDILKSI